MIVLPNIDPIALQLGPLPIRWYGLMYIVGFVGFLVLGKWRAKQPKSPVTPEQVDDLMFLGALGVILGGRIGYIFLYSFDKFVENPLILFKVYEGGMSFHGGLIGVLMASFYLAKKYKIQFLQMGDFIAPLVPIGLAAGRLANFINQELWGKPTDVPWGVVFPASIQDGVLTPRHPSQLYEMFLEGFLLFIILWFYSRVPRPIGRISGLFLLFYGLFRAFVEFFRLPDSNIGYIAFGWLTKGQLYSLPMILIGLGLILYSCRKKAKIA
ncbi:MAG: prolipoprotein diacylglyceryl transferase [Thiotrichaceae bacterium]|nr:prolipoprotein diacylglyceryl transferase [Thiotrichaceae bacterium]